MEGMKEAARSAGLQAAPSMGRDYFRDSINAASCALISAMTLSSPAALSFSSRSRRKVSGSAARPQPRMLLYSERMALRLVSSASTLLLSKENYMMGER